MMKRLTWFISGAAAGVVGASVAKKKVKAKAAELSPANLAHKAVERVREVAHDGVEAIKAKVIKLKASEVRDPMGAESATSADVIELHRRKA